MYVDVHCLDESRPIKSCLAKTATSLRSGMKTANALLCQHSLKRKMSESLHTLRFTPMRLLTTQPKFQRALAPLPSGLALGHEDQCADKHLDLRFGTWTWLTLGNLARVAFRGYRTCDLWLLTLNVQLLLRWLRTAGRLCWWSLTQRISFIFGLDPRKTCLTALCTLQPKHREGHDFLALRGISISALKFAKRAKLDECRRNIPGAQTKGGKYFYTFGSCLDWYASTLSKDCEGHIPTSDASPQTAMDSMLLHPIWNTLILRAFWAILRVKLIASSRDEKMQMLETAELTCKALWQVLVLAVYCVLLW